jgi:imidazolonepropionase-like amidohydrolase
VRHGVRLVHHATSLDAASFDTLVAARESVWVCPGLHYLRAMVEGKAAPYGITADHTEAALYPEEMKASIDGLRALHRAGVRIVAGGDFGHQWTHHGTYAAELAAYVELLGLSPLDALVTATANAGPLVGDQLGQIAPGHLADLVVLSADPLTNIRSLLDPAVVGPVYKSGRRYSPA